MGKDKSRRMNARLLRSLMGLFIWIGTALPTAAAPAKYDLVVAQDGSGQFKTVQAALDAVPDFRKQETRILIRKGIYKEKLVLATSKIMVTLVGEDVKKTILTFDDYAQKKNRFGEEVGTTGPGARNLWEVPNVLQQKFPAETFMVTTKMTFKPNSPKLENEKAGLAVLGLSYASLALQSKKDGLYLVQALGKDAGQGKEEKQKVLMKVAAPTVYFRVKVLPGAQCQFSYSFDGQQFTDTGDAFPAEVGRWKGAKVGLFCTRETQTNDSGYVDVDWFRVEPVQ